MIEATVEEELEATLGAGRSQRVGAARNGYRHGARERQLTTSIGKTTIMLPRARLKNADGNDTEWHSRIIPRYQRRTERVDCALLGSYLSGINSRRLRGALSPLMRRAPVSKDAVSRLVGRLRANLPRGRREICPQKGLLHIYGRLVSACANLQEAHPGADLGTLVKILDESECWARITRQNMQEDYMPPIERPDVRH